MPFEFLDIVEGLTRLDPIRTYPQRGADLVSKLAGGSAFRLELTDGSRFESTPPPTSEADAVLPLRSARRDLGTLYVCLPDGHKLANQELRLVRWAARLFSKCLCYVERLGTEGGRRVGLGIEETLARSPLTPRERDVVSLLASGASTREMAARAGLTVATVNTYLKRIFSKLGVHSRVELVARVSGTDISADKRADVSADSEGSKSAS